MRQAVVQRSSMTQVPADTPLEQLAAWRCGITTGSGCVFKTWNARANASFAVFGGEAVGWQRSWRRGSTRRMRSFAVDLQERHTVRGVDEDLIQRWAQEGERVASKARPCLIEPIHYRPPSRRHDIPLLPH